MFLLYLIKEWRILCDPVRSTGCTNAECRSMSCVCRGQLLGIDNLSAHPITGFGLPVWLVYISLPSRSTKLHRTEWDIITLSSIACQYKREKWTLLIKASTYVLTFCFFSFRCMDRASLLSLRMYVAAYFLFASILYQVPSVLKPWIRTSGHVYRYRTTWWFIFHWKVTQSSLKEIHSICCARELRNSSCVKLRGSILY